MQAVPISGRIVVQGGSLIRFQDHLPGEDHRSQGGNNIVDITFMNVSNGIHLGSLPKELLTVDERLDNTGQDR